MANKNTRKTIFFIWCALCVCCFIVFYVMNSMMCSGPSDGTCMEVDEVTRYFLSTFIAQVGNAGLVFALLWYFGMPAVQKMIADRKADIERDIIESTKAKDEAQEVYSNAQIKMAGLHADVRKMTKNYQEATEVECAQIAENAVATAERLRKDAEVSFELQANVARSAFEKEVMVEAIDRAKQEIINKLSSDAALKNKLIDQSIASLKL